MVMKHIGEIDGLRAIAVSSVLLFHVDKTFLSGGFVGVDVFFVISGFLITRIVLREIDAGTFSLARFYQRRVLRIVPALFVTLAVTACLFLTLTPPAFTPDISASLLAAVFSYSNLWFYSTVDYFGDQVFAPALHTWSLAVEEQFYLVFPLLLILIGTDPAARHRRVMTLALGAASFVAAAITVFHNQAMAFYLPWLRGWELLAGALLAMYPIERIRQGVKQGLSAAGLCMIATACLVYRDSMQFPGASAALPVLGAGAVIAGAGAGGAANALLRLPFMTWMGKISYSVYLVHWPLTCLAAMLVSLYPLKIRILVVIASVILGWLSWRYVEQPFRTQGTRLAPRKVLLAFASSCLVLLVSIPLLQIVSEQFWSRHPDALALSAALKSDTSWFRAGSCFLTPKFDDVKFFKGDECLRAGNGKDSVLVIGDSHAANLVTGLALQHESLNVLQATSSGCRPTPEAQGPARCVKLMQYIFQDWLPKHSSQVRYIVIAGRWEPLDIAPLKRLVSDLRKMGMQVVVVGPSVEYYVPVPLILAYENISGFRLQDRLAKRERFAADKQFSEALADEDITYFSPNLRLCPNGRCQLLHRGAPTFFDRDHLTHDGVALVLQDFPLP
ncbi:MAG: hypothetical protein JWL63_614 [Rhodocyclales bacterium]|nr:hypothetical protein [Rhodocyclales bacterium]